MLLIIERIIFRIVLWYLEQRLRGKSNQQLLSDVKATIAPPASTPTDPEPASTTDDE